MEIRFLVHKRGDEEWVLFDSWDLVELYISRMFKPGDTVAVYVIVQNHCIDIIFPKLPLL